MTESKYGNSSWRIGVVRSPLSVASSAFERIAAQELPADPRPVPQPVPWSRVQSWRGLRALLCEPGVPTARVDQIWVWLIERSRAYGEDATLVCASLAYPMLAGTAGLFAAPASPQRHDIESEVLTGFLTHLERVELDQPGVWHRLRWASYRAAIRAVRQQDVITESVADHDDDLDRDLDPSAKNRRVMVTEPGHPETVLALAVADGVITAGAAELIALTRWEHRPLNCLAAERGDSHWALRKRRQRAEARLVAWLAERARDTAAATTTETRVLNTLPSHNHATATAAADTDSTHRDRRRATHRTRTPQPRRRAIEQTSPTPARPDTDDQEVRSCA
ncbi:hypothetical protein [Nocardia pneumoniae]|uniref:hypothetical protein n=1 Tax=Nocardia pneumoniae TaxID=228601 RepID=UPI0012F646CD|nr:hypothetical protein [Nocardia pneumoniae]